MTDRHQHRADDHRAALAEHAVGERAAEDRRQVNEAGVEAIDLRGERLDIERPENAFEYCAQRREADDRFGMPGSRYFTM